MFISHRLRACSAAFSFAVRGPHQLAAVSSSPILGVPGTHFRNPRADSEPSTLLIRAPRQVVAAAMSSDASSSAANDLRGKSCVGMCGKDTPKLSKAEIQEMRKAVPLWKLSEDQTTISKEFVARNFTAALKFLNDAGAVAEAEGHHPDFHLTNYRNISVVLTTHSINALSLPDFILAAKLDALEVDYSPKWLRENPEFDASGPPGGNAAKA